MKAIFDVLGLALIVVLATKVWGMWQVQSAPDLAAQPLLAAKFEASPPAALNGIQAIACERKTPLPWEQDARLTCQVEAGKVMGVAVTVSTEIVADANEPVFGFDVRKTAKGQYQVSAAIDKETVYPATAERVLRKQLQQVSDSLQTPSGGRIKDAKAEAERRKAVKDAWSAP